MNGFRVTLMALATGWAALSTAAQAEEEVVIPVPGFADFLVVDGNSVWATNRGRVERWSREGKLAEVATTRPCGAMAIYKGDLWFADCKEGVVKRVDTKTAKVMAAIATGIANPKGELNVVAGAGSIWIASDGNGTVARIDPTTNTVIASIPVDAGTFYLSFGFGSLWAVSSDKQSVQRIDPKTNSVTKRTTLGPQPGFLAAGAGAIWVQEQGDGTVARIDPVSGDVTGRVKVGDNLKYGDIDTGRDKVWLRTTDDQMFAVIDPKTMTVEARKGKASGSGALRYTKAGVWTSAHDQHTLSWWALPLK